jgi:phosphoglucosamine mutase
MSNLGLVVACRKYGFEHHAAKVGDRYVLEEMRALDAVLGGEDSGHTIFLEHHTTGDGILTAIKLVTAVLRAGQPLSELAKLMDVFPQKLINVEVSSKPDVDTIPEITAAIARAEADLAGEGRVLVRYSGTQNLCRVMVEGPTVEATERHAREVADVVRAAIGA